MTETILEPDLLEAGWTLSDDGRSIMKSYKFRNFREALAWMVRAGFEAEAMNHHPDWRNVWNMVEVRLTTHDTGGLTGKDIELAHRLERLRG